MRWAIGAVCVAIVATACGTVPGAAASIDGTKVSMSVVRDRTDAVMTAQGTEEQQQNHQLRARVDRNQLTAVIRHHFVRAVATDRDIAVGDADINDFVEQFGSSAAAQQGVSLAQLMGVPDEGVRAAVYDFLVLQQLDQGVADDGAEVTNVTVTVDAVPAADRAAAVAARVKYLDDPAAMTTDAKAARATNPQLPGGTESLLANPAHAVFGIFSAPEGSVLLVPQGTDGYLVTRITDRTQEPTSLTQSMIARVYQSQGLGAEMALSSLLLAAYADDVDVTVNPRFGHWDPRVMRVVAPDAAQ